MHHYLMQPYDDALREILEHGVSRTNQRTGVKTKAIFGIEKRYRLDTGRFPILTKRKVWPKAIFGELLWFISGSTNNNDLEALGSKIWRPWVSEEFEKKHGFGPGCFGPVYGFQLRHFGGCYGNGMGGENALVGHTLDDLPDDYEERRRRTMDRTGRNVYGYAGFDQLDWMVKRIKEDPTCRRILFTLWNPLDVNSSRLPPCHYTYQVLIDDERRMTGVMTQRSCDFPVGVPANIQFYSALTVMLAQQTGYEPCEFVHNTVDSHIYEDQIPAVEEYLSRPAVDSPKLTINMAPNIFMYKMTDFELADYNPLDKIDIPVAV